MDEAEKRGGGEEKAETNGESEPRTTPNKTAARDPKPRGKAAGRSGKQGKGRFYKSYERLREVFAPDLPVGAWQPRKAGGWEARVTRERAPSLQTAGAPFFF